HHGGRVARLDGLEPPGDRRRDRRRRRQRRRLTRLDEFSGGRRSHSHRPLSSEENAMSATYTFDVFSSLDGFAAAAGDWSGYWGKQGPELLQHRLESFGPEQRMVFGATTFREFVGM